MIDEASNQNDQNYLKSLHLLYVEDEDDVRTQMVDFLQRRVKKFTPLSMVNRDLNYLGNMILIWSLRIYVCP